MKIKKILGGMMVAVAIVAPAIVLAAGASLGGTPATNGSAPTRLINPINANTFSELVALVIKTAVDVLMPFVILAFIYSGFLFVMAQGNDEKLGKAKSAITWSMVGAFILFGAWGFAQLISQTLSTVIN